MLHSTIVESLVDVIDDHAPNGLAAVRLMQEVARQSGRGDFGDMLMLADRGNLILVQTTKVNAILQRNHAYTPGGF
jgi:hypothetical protein